ncbi:MAG: isocitrate lyase/phosphoenolpyruvate mutase family protein, partial [Chlamydiales bacterium]
VQEIGAKVIATGSWSVAAAHGYDDGEKLPFDMVLANIQRIIANVDIPITIDFEGGYGKSPIKVQDNILKIIETGVVGINFEDQIIDGEGLYSIEDQCARISAIREVEKHTGIPIFINARTDLFFKTDAISHNNGLLEEALVRASAYAESGANGFFVPGLKDAKYIEKLCERSPIPINIMVMSDTPKSKQLAELGVARISYGPGPYCQAMDFLKQIGIKALSMN